MCLWLFSCMLRMGDRPADRKTTAMAAKRKTTQGNSSTEKLDEAPPYVCAHGALQKWLLAASCWLHTRLRRIPPAKKEEDRPMQTAGENKLNFKTGRTCLTSGAVCIHVVRAGPFRVVCKIVFHTICL